MADVDRVRTELGSDDDRLLRDTLEGETEVFEAIDDQGELVIADMALVERAEERLKRIKSRLKERRDLMLRMIAQTGLKSLERSLFTASVSQRQELIEVPTNEELPTLFFNKPTPNRTLIAKTLRAGNAVPGYAMQDKGELTLVMRSDRPGVAEETE